MRIVWHTYGNYEDTCCNRQRIVAFYLDILILDSRFDFLSWRTLFWQLRGYFLSLCVFDESLLRLFITVHFFQPVDNGSWISILTFFVKWLEWGQPWFWKQTLQVLLFTFWSLQCITTRCWLAVPPQPPLPWPPDFTSTGHWHALLENCTGKKINK